MIVPPPGTVMIATRSTFYGTSTDPGQTNAQLLSTARLQAGDVVVVLRESPTLAFPLASSSERPGRCVVCLVVATGQIFTVQVDRRMFSLLCSALEDGIAEAKAQARAPSGAISAPDGDVPEGPDGDVPEGV